MTDCPRFGKLIGGCRFEARYDLGGIDTSPLAGIDVRGSEAVMLAIKSCRTETYVHDICIRCGKTINRALPKGEAA